MAIRDIIYLIILVFLIVLSGCFSGMDMAYSSLKLTRLEKEAKEHGSKANQRTLKFASDYDSTIATILFGNDFVNILASSLASLFSKDVLEPLIGELASTVTSLVLLVILLIFGEILPKAISKDHAYLIARIASGFLAFLKYLFLPFVYPTSRFTAFLSTKLIGKTGKESVIATDDELVNMVDEIEKEGIIDSDQSELIHKSIDFKETNCY